jgi:flavin reductase (DIM6/NTAB) family NADH-FMN oxidoreductase RutF
VPSSTARTPGQAGRALPDGDRFAGVGWEADPDHSVFIHDSSAWLDCSLYDEVRAGDHTIALLEIHGLCAAPHTPLLIFHGSRFRRMATVLTGKGVPEENIRSAIPRVMVMKVRPMMPEQCDSKRQRS